MRPAKPGRAISPRPADFTAGWGTGIVAPMSNRARTTTTMTKKTTLRGGPFVMRVI